MVDETPEGLNAEALANLWGFTLTQAQANQATVDDVVAFVRSLESVRSRQIFERFGTSHPMVMYLWFDELAAQLRLSLVSEGHGKLPFGVPLNVVHDPTIVAHAFLASGEHDGIPLSAFVPYSPEADIEPPNAEREPLCVWTTRIPQEAWWGRRDSNPGPSG